MIRISRQNRDIYTRIALPASKSISNRLLILQFHYGSSLQIGNLSRAEDSVLLGSLLELVRLYTSTGSQGILRLDTHNAGTVFRFLAALLSITRGHFYLTGHDRMKERPVGPLVEALRSMGADIEYVERVGFAPILIKGHNFEGGTVRVDASQSSQFLSALLLIAPMLENGLVIEHVNPPVSWPYVKMTLKILESLGIKVLVDKDKIRVMPKESVNRRVIVEPDWSASSFWYCMLALADRGEIRFPGLFSSGYQGDESVAQIFANMGIVTDEDGEGTIIRVGDQSEFPVRIDFSDIPDLAMPVILAQAVKGRKYNFTGLERLRLKESDRLSTLERELEKIGIILSQISANLWVTDGSIISPGDLFVQDEDDHRIAMTFACLAMIGFNILIEEPSVVNKSYPGFWKDMESAGFEIQHSC